jgi:hypothetical protein
MPDPPADWAPHIGRKVTMRYLLGRGDHPHTELVGVLQAVYEGEDGVAMLKVLDKRGETHHLRQADVVAAKIF